MIDINDLRAPALSMNILPNVDGIYTMHYDETNNIRRLHLTPRGFNARALQCFVLGGVAHHGTPPPLDFEDLRTILQLQKSTLELKLGHLAKGDFPDLLGSQKIETFLEWVSDQDLFIHYHVLDPLYWSIVDIVDSIITEDGSNQLMMSARILKNDLHTILRSDLTTTEKFLGQYTYPNIGRHHSGAFITELRKILEYNRQLLPVFNYQKLKGLLQIAENLDSLPYLENEPPNILIDGFGFFYLQRIALFKNSTHILDTEKVIQNYIYNLCLCDGSIPVRNFSFIDSKNSPWVQVSDVMVGILGKLFGFVNRTPLIELRNTRSQFTQRQIRGIDMLSSLIGRSIEECPAFAHSVISLEDQKRLESFLGL